MTIWTALVLGLLIGWIVEWVIDWVYWRQRTQNSAAELENLRVQNNRLRADINASNQSLDKLKADLAAASSGAAAHADRDSSAGKSDGQLANLQADHARLQAELETLNASLATAQSERDSLRAELDRLRAPTPTAIDSPDTGSQYKTQLLSIDPTLARGAEGVHLSDSGDERSDAASERLRAELAAANGEIERLRAQLDSGRQTVAVGEPARDALIDINGIGPVYEQRLFDAGIYTFADLAAQSPERLRELVGAKSWQDIETEAWIAEAQQFVQAGRGRSKQ